MTQLEITHQTAKKLETLSKKTRWSVDTVLNWLLSNYGHELIANDERTEMIQVTPLTGKEIVEGGFTGGWEHKQIDDPVAFLEQQRAKRKKDKFT